MRAIQAILFDFGGTLDHDGVDWFVRFYRAMTRRRETLPEETFYQHASQVAQHLDTLPDTAELPLAGMVVRLCEHLHALMSNHGRPRPLTWRHADIADEFVAESHRYFERNRPVLAQLRRRFRLGVISNNWGNTAGWCAEHGLAPYLDVMIDSKLVGAAKPDPRIFQAALDALGLPAAACVYVGDRYDADVRGAHAAGLTSIWLTGAEPRPAPDPAVPCATIAQLPDLLRLDLLR
jgi:putative hydrolase of the HAD superfamily